MNLYAYVANDPINKTDPSGELFQIVVGAAAGFAIDLFQQTVIEGKGFDQIDKGRLATSTAIGGLTGGAGLFGAAAKTRTLNVLGVRATGLGAAERVALGANGLALGAGAAVAKEGQAAQLQGREPETGVAAIVGGVKAFNPVAALAIDKGLDIVKDALS